MTRTQLQNHLMLQGWYPVEATRAALQRGTERVFVIEMPGLTTAAYYVHPDHKKRVEVPWAAISAKHLLVLVNKIETINNAGYNHD